MSYNRRRTWRRSHVQEAAVLALQVRDGARVQAAVHPAPAGVPRARAANRRARARALRAAAGADPAAVAAAASVPEARAAREITMKSAAGQKSAAGPRPP